MIGLVLRGGSGDFFAAGWGIARPAASLFIKIPMIVLCFSNSVLHPIYGLSFSGRGCERREHGRLHLLRATGFLIFRPAIILSVLLLSGILAPAAFAQKDTSSLKNYSPVPIGVAIGYNPMKHNTRYADIVASQFDHVTFEYALKNGAIVRPDGQLDYERADELVKICRSKGLNIYGHTLCWYQNNSPYLATLQGDSTAIEDFLKHYITTTVSRYKEVIYAWDVVNEAIDNDGQLRTEGKTRSDYF